MNRLSKENKLIFVMGDFNLNLLNCESHSEMNDFLNCMVLHCLLSYILHPTRVTDHSATVINNIFCNNTAYDTFSGNIPCKISDHFPRFIALDKFDIDYKTFSYATRGYSRFDEQKFISDLSFKSMAFLDDPSLSLHYKFEKFYQNLSSCVDQHVSTKKMTQK